MRHCAVEDAVGQGIEGDLHPHPRVDAHDIGLAQVGGLDVHGARVAQQDGVGAGGDLLAQPHVDCADLPGKGREHLRLAQLGHRAGDGRPRRLHPRLGHGDVLGGGAGQQLVQSGLGAGDLGERRPRRCFCRRAAILRRRHLGACGVDGSRHYAQLFLGRALRRDVGLGLRNFQP